MDEINWDKDIWDVINSYFQNTENYLSNHQIESYNTFLDTNISKTIRQFNPIILPYGKDTATEKYKFEIRITIGGRLSEDGTVINDGSSINIGKPNIQEITKTTGDIILRRKTLYPNEARLKNLTYKCAITSGIIIEFYTDEDSEKMDQAPDLKRYIPPKSYNISLTNNLPIMLQSKICSLSGLSGSSLRLMGECEYDQGGYFIIDGKEKVIVAQERQIENKPYINKYGLDHRYKFSLEIRSAPEHKFQPSRVTKCFVLNKRVTKNETIEENSIRISIPNINGEIPIVVIFRALGIISDYDICAAIVDNFEDPVNKQILNLLEPSIKEGAFINNQKDALEFIESKISTTFMKKNIHRNKRKHFLATILKNYLLPHTGTNNFVKGYYVGYIIKELILSLLNIKGTTDRDSYIYKRVDISGFLLSAIFRDLYFRIKTKMAEDLNKLYNNHDIKNEGFYWNNFSGSELEQLGYKNYRFYNIISDIGADSAGGGLSINNVVDTTIMDEGLLYAFKNCWGLKNAPCKQGVIQDMNRLSYLGAVSHIRRVNTPLSKSAKVRAPHSLHLSSFGIMCPDETPDGGNVGLRKNISLFANITSGTDSSNLMRVLYNSSLEDILQHDVGKFNYTKVFLNERLVGYTKKPMFLNAKMKLLKRNALINVYTSIAWYINDNVIKISTDSGRGVRPVFVVNNSKILLTKEHLRKLSDAEIAYTWYHLIAGSLNNNPVPFYNTDAAAHNSPHEFNNNLEELEKTAGIIEYIDPEESNVGLIAMYPRDLENKLNKYNYCEIHPAINFGVLASAIPGIEMNQHPRNQFSTGQGKQALGVYTSNFRNRMDTKGQIMYYPQRPLIKSKLAKYLRVDELPHGINAIIAVGCYSGYNQEDSIIFNKSSVQKGLFKTTKFRTFSEREDIDGVVKKEFIRLPRPSETDGLKSGNYRKLDENGIIEEGSQVNENDVLVGKCVSSGSVRNGTEKFTDASQFVKRNEEGFVDKVYSNTGNNDQRYVKVRIRKDKYPEVGDKFCSRHGQKGTVGMLLPAEDMPCTKDGIIPDLIVNPHAFPSRMTIAQFFETLLGKVCMTKGFLSEIVPFSENNIENVANILENNCGYEKYGNEVLYSGITGQQMKVNFFIGPTYYLRLTHQVSDKFQSRDDGLKTALTHQPVGGRALGGGGRIGEMERDCALSHGIASFLKESFMERSDKYKFYISTKNGMITACNPAKNIFRDFSNDETKQYIDDTSIVKKPVDYSDSDIVCIEAPYSFKLFLQEVESMGIAPRLIAKSVLQEWNKINNKLIPQIKLEAALNSKSYGSSVLQNNTNILPLRRFHNQIKFNLISGASRKNGSLVDFSCGKGGDIYNWYQARYTKILAIDSSSDNIESDDPQIPGANKRITDMKSDSDIKLNLWANNSTIDFIAGDVSKNINSGLLADKKYKTSMDERLLQYGGNFADCVSMLFSIHNLFDSVNKVEMMLNNVASVLRSNGMFIVTTLDGPSIFDALKLSDANIISGNVYNSSSDTTSKVWQIRADPELDLTNNVLPNTLSEGFGNDIHVTFDSDRKEIKQCLVHPTILISMAAAAGLELVNHNVLHKQTELFSKPTGLFGDIYSKYMKQNPDDVEAKELNSKTNKGLKQYSNLHRYFIFRKNPNTILPKTSFESEAKCLKISNKLNYIEPRYPIINISHPIALDTFLMQKYITEHRHLIGNNRVTINKYDNSITDNTLPESSDILKDINTKLDSDFYKGIDNVSYLNTLNYIYHYVKVGIYVRIVNSVLVQFVPIFNYSPDGDGLLANDGEGLQFTIPNIDESSEIPISFEEYLIHKFNNSSLSVMVSDKKMENSYNVKINESIESSLLSNKHIIVDGDRVLLGTEAHLYFKHKITKYRSLIETVCNAKHDKISSSEFIINVLHNPILNVKDEDIVNPFSQTLKEQAKHITITGNILPVLSETEKPGYLDIAIPTTTDWEYVNEDLVIDMCGVNIPIPPPDQKLSNYIGVISNFDGPLDNDRMKLLENIENLGNYDEHDDLREYGIDVFMYNTKINNILENDTISICNSNKLEDIMEADINKFPHDARIHLFIDGFGSDEILSIVAKCPSVLFRLKSSDNSPKLWYEKHLVSYNIDEPFNSSPTKFIADYVLLNSIDDLRKALDFVIDNPLLASKLIKNKTAKINRLINKTTVIDYMQVVLNKIGTKMSSEQISSEIFVDRIDENIIRKNIHIPEKFLGILIGKGGSNIKNLQHHANVKINLNSETFTHENGDKLKTVTIIGGITGVNIAANMVTKLAASITTYVYIESKHMGRLIGPKMAHKRLIETSFGASVYLSLQDAEILDNFNTARAIYDTVQLNDITFSDFQKKYKLFKILSSEESLDEIMSSIGFLLLRNDRIAKKYIAACKTNISKVPFSYTDPFLLLLNSSVWSDDAPEEVSENIAVLLPSGWKKVDIVFSDIIYESVILDIFNMPTQTWQSQNGTVPTTSPVGWNERELNRYGIFSHTMHDWLVSHRTSDNWANGLASLRTNMSSDLPITNFTDRPTLVLPSSPITGDFSGFTDSPVYTATSPAYAETSPAYATGSAYNPVSPAYNPVSPEYDPHSWRESDYRKSSPVKIRQVSEVNKDTILIVIPYNEPLVPSPHQYAEIPEPADDLFPSIQEDIIDEEEVNDVLLDGDAAAEEAIVEAEAILSETASTSSTKSAVSVKSGSSTKSAVSVKSGSSTKKTIKLKRNSTNKKQSGGGLEVYNDPFHTKMTDFITELESKLDDYIHTSGINKTYKIILLKHDKDTMDISDIDSKLIPRSFIQSQVDQQCKMNFNKGALYNTAAHIVNNNSNINTIVFHEPFLVPNEFLVPHYFNDPGSCVVKLASNVDHPVYNSDNKLGIFSINKQLFNKISMPNHIWSYVNIDALYIDLIKSKSVQLKNIVDPNIVLKDINPTYHVTNNSPDNNLITTEDMLHLENFNINQLSWYNTTNITSLGTSGKSILYHIELNQSCMPLSNIVYPHESLDQYPISLSASVDSKILEKLTKELFEYLSLFINRTISEKINITVNVIKHISTLHMDVTSLDRLEVLNTIYRLNTQLALLKTHLLLPVVGDRSSIFILDDSYKMILEKYSFIIYSTKESEINIKLELISGDSEHNLQIKHFNPLNKSSTITFNNLIVTNYDYINRTMPPAELVDYISSMQLEALATINKSKLSEYKTKLSEFMTADLLNKYAVIEEFGYITLLFDTERDNVCYLLMDNLEIKTTYKDLIIDLSSKEFLIIMDYKKDKMIDTVPGGHDDIKSIHSEFLTKYTKGSAVIIKTGKYKNQTGVIDEIFMDSVDITLFNNNPEIIKSVNIKISVEDPSLNVILLEDILLDTDAMEEGDIDGDPVKKIGLFNDYKLNIKVVVEDEAGAISVVDQTQFNLSDNMTLQKKD